MIILGIDPGTTLIGFGVIDYTNKGFACIDYGTIKNPGLDKFNIIKSATDSIVKLIDIHKPDRIGLEKLFFFKNQKTVMAVSEMRGAILHSILGKGLAVHEFTPLEVKKTVCNYGLADKKQVQKMVKLLLKLDQEVKPDDAADALAIAICTATT